ncbi:MAG: hypothetical protein WA154_06320 [Moraxellaceae bacterium]
MCQPTKKIDTLRDFMQQESWPQALSLAAKFPRLGNEKAAIVRAHECLVNPSFYRQLGVDTEQAIQAGIAALKARYS